MSSLATSAVTATALVTASPEACDPRLRLRRQISDLYVSSERSNYIFSSPLGPGYRDGRHFTLPRFVYFGPHTHEESLRLAFYAEDDAQETRSSLALLHLIERLSVEPDLGQGLNLSFFPLIDATDAKTVDIPSTSVAEANWATSSRPEVELLRRDVRARGYHGFVRISAADVEEITVSLRGEFDLTTPHSGVEILSSDDFLPLDVRWEADPLGAPVRQGPLTLSDDLPFHAFALDLRVPRQWSEALYREAVGLILRRFIQRYRGLQAYGQHL